jgi:hypothetical protein
MPMRKLRLQKLDVVVFQCWMKAAMTALKLYISLSSIFYPYKTLEPGFFSGLGVLSGD